MKIIHMINANKDFNTHEEYSKNLSLKKQKMFYISLLGRFVPNKTIKNTWDMS